MPSIEDEEGTRQAQELPRQTGRTMTEVLRISSSKKLVTLRSVDPREQNDERVRRLLELGRRIRADLGSKAGTSAHDDLYDADGLPS